MHHAENLITLCNMCHGKYGQKVDKAMISCKSEEELRLTDCYEMFQKWMGYTTNRFVSNLPIPKNFIEKLDDEIRLKLVDIIFKELRKVGFPYSNFTNEELIRDFENIKNSTTLVIRDALRPYNTSGSKIREHFIHEQYRDFLEIFEKDEELLKVIRNRLGFDWATKPVFFNMSFKTIIKGFEVLYPDKRFSKYKPSVAKWIVDKFCKSDTVFDYSAGWSDRLLGTIAAGKNYIGMDTNPNLVKELNKCSEWLKTFNKQKIEIIYGDSSTYSRQMEFAYSCPPYGSLEAYTGSNYRDDNEWLNTFMLPVLDMCQKNLVSNGTFVCHISKKLSELIKFELESRFEKVALFDVVNKYDPYHEEKERVNEVIMVYRKR